MALHKLFEDILAAHGMPQGQTFQADCGRRRIFHTAAERALYETGYEYWPYEPGSGRADAFMTGWYDRDQEETDMQEARREAQEERDQE